jgi:hypothetical protein
MKDRMIESVWGGCVRLNTADTMDTKLGHDRYSGWRGGATYGGEMVPELGLVYCIA